MTDSAPDEVSSSSQIIKQAVNCEVEPRPHRWFDGFLRCFKPIWVSAGKSNIHEIKESSWELSFEDIKELQFLGSGAQGAVFSGYLNGEWVAVKKVREKTDTDIKHLKKLSHPNIVAFKGVCVHPPCYAIVMEYCPYGTLYNLLHQGTRVPPRKVTEWSKEVASGMHYLHSHKIIHRDLKSENILIGYNEELKISDFGTSKQWNDKSMKMSFAGTVAWMAPEVIRNELCTEKVDIWSFGVVMWELLTCETPYQGVDSSAIIWGVGSNSLHLPIPSTCPDGFTLLLKQCWNTKPKNRPSFRHIMMHVDIAAVEILSTPDDQYFQTQVTWKQEIGTYMQNIKSDGYGLHTEEGLIKKRQEELQHAQDIRMHYEEKLEKANHLYLELLHVFESMDQNKSDSSRDGSSIQQSSGSAKLVKKRNRRFVKNDKLNRAKSPMQSDATAKSMSMKYSAYHSPSAARIRRTKYYSTYPKSQKSSQPFRRTKSLNLKRRSELPHSIDSGTQTDAVSINELSIDGPYKVSDEYLIQKNHLLDAPEFLLKENSKKLPNHCSCSFGGKCNVAFCNKLNQTKHDCVICYMWSHHVQSNHSDKVTDRPSRFFKKNHPISKIRSFLKGNLKKYSSTQEINNGKICDTTDSKSLKSFFSCEKLNKMFSGKSAVQKLSSLSFPNIPVCIDAEVS